MRAEIEASFLFTERALSKPHLVPLDVAKILGFMIANLCREGHQSLELKIDFLVFLERGKVREFNWSNSFLEKVMFAVDVLSGMRLVKTSGAKNGSHRSIWIS